jgi:hypothetical protein
MLGGGWFWIQYIVKGYITINLITEIGDFLRHYSTELPMFLDSVHAY